MRGAPAAGAAAATHLPDDAAAPRGVPATVAEAHARLADQLRDGGVEGARDAARDLLAALLDVSRSWPVVHGADRCSPALWSAADSAAGRLARRMPFAYAVGRASFRHLTLAVDERVLIPRPETELLVELVLARVAAGGEVADVGTGSGAIALSLATEGRFDRVHATDLSLDALAVARANAARLGARLRTAVDFHHGALLAPLAGRRLRAVVANPPYVASGEAGELPAAVRDWEPAVALFSGPDGLDATRRLIAEAAEVLEPGGLLALEGDSRRAGCVAELLAGAGAYRDVVVRPDLTGRDRFVLATRRP